MSLKGFVGSEYFSTKDSVLDFTQLKELFDRFDIIHFHWVVGMLDYPNIASVLQGKPIVWTTADMNPFTGGCHYSEGCEGFITDCKNCPLISNENTLPAQFLSLKQSVFEQLDIHLICPSNHIANLARKSKLFRGTDITVIPNAYPTDKFTPININYARKKINLPKDKKLILFGSEDVSNKRKGGDILLKISNLLKKYDDWSSYAIVLFGKGKVNLPIQTYNLGSIDQENLKYVYSSCDVFVSLSREDVGPMTVIEALLCGTPVVGFPIGVIPDIVTHKENGYIAKPFEAEDILKGIEWATRENGKSDQKAIHCSQVARKYADPEVAAKRHKELYLKILGRSI